MKPAPKCEKEKMTNKLEGKQKLIDYAYQRCTANYSKHFGTDAEYTHEMQKAYQNFVKFKEIANCNPNNIKREMLEEIVTEYNQAFVHLTRPPQ
jgi:uncharacterized membrane-anchored protein YhcB (DUF1043 family)